MKKFKILMVGTDDDLYRLIDLQLKQFTFIKDMDIIYEFTNIKCISFEFIRAFDLIIIDMTHKDFTTLNTSKYREMSRDRFKIVLVGESLEYGLVRGIFRSGAFDYWIRPYDAPLIEDALKNIIDMMFEKIKLPELRQKIVHAMEGISELTPHDYGLFYTHSIHPQFDKELLYANIYTVIIELIEPISFEPMELDKKEVAALCTNWIIEKDNPHKAMFNMLIHFGDIYSEIYHPKVQSKIIRKAIIEVLSPKQHHKSVKYIADTLYVNQSHLSYTFKKHTGVSLSEYIKKIKLYGAMWMLVQQNYSIDDILNILEYKDEQYFSKIFKEKTGMFPKSFREKNQKYQNRN